MIAGLTSILPSGLSNWLRKIRKKRLYWEGDYASWEKALSHASGYDEISILEKTAASVNEVLKGNAAFERDSVAFYEPAIDEDLLRRLSGIAEANNGRLEICDFGGSLGSTYLQHRTALESYQVSWSIIEQAHYVSYGQSHIQVPGLEFHTGLDSYRLSHGTQVLLLSSVLSYLPEPFGWLQKMLDMGFEHILIDKTPIHPGNRTRLTVQHVPSSIYRASYPCWFLAEDRLKDMLAHYELNEEYEVEMDCNLGLPHKGYVYTLK